MAKLSGPLMSAEARGRVGGLVYNTWRGIRYAKAKTGPAQPRTQLQLAIRAIAITLARKWQSIGAPAIAAWNYYATQHTETDFTNTPVRLSGLNWYLRLNTRLMHAHNAIITNPPPLPAPDAVVAFAAVGGVGDIDCTWTDPLNATWNVTLYIQGPHSKGAISSLRKARWNVNASAAGGTHTITGLIPGFYSVWARSFDTVNGLVSAFVVATATVT